MTNAIEQAKRVLFNRLKYMKQFALHNSYGTERCTDLELAIENYLEITRQDHEALHETARARFEDTRKLEAANQELLELNKKWQGIADNRGEHINRVTEQLAKMTEERDSIQLRLHAVDHAYKTQQDQAGTSGQVSGDRASCATPDAKTMVILKALMDAQRIMTDYLVPDGIRAKDAIGKLIPVLDNQKLVTAMNGFEEMVGYGTWFINNDKCMHSFFAIGGDQMKCTFCGVGK